jgi:hypothetical protein
MNRFLCKLAALLLLGATVIVARPAPAQAGRIGGPSTALVFAPAYDSVFYDAPFVAGEPALVTIAGDGNANLELYVYDADGHVSPAFGFGDRKLAAMTVYRSGFFVIEVRNRGPWASTVVVTTN